MSIFSKLQPYLLPPNPLSQSFLQRSKLGILNYATVRSWWAIKPLQEWIRRRNFSFQCSIDGHNKTISVSGGDPTHLWVANEVLVEQVYDLNHVPFIPEVIFDFGANIGMFSLLAATRWPNTPIVCVEPHPATFTQLGINLHENRISATMLQCAVDDEPGIKFLQNEGAVFQELSETPTSITVLCVTMDSIISTAKNRRILLKLDIEGSEESALPSLSQKLPADCFIFIELHRGDSSLTWMKKWASENSFVFTEVRRRGDAIDGYLSR